MSSAELVAHIGDERRLALIDQFRDTLHDARLLHQPGDFGDHDLISAAPGFLFVPARAYAKRAAAAGIGFGDRLARIDHEPAGREIRAGHVFHQRLAARVRIVDQEQRGVAQLRSIVWRDRGGHADRNTLRAIGQQIGEGARQDDRLIFRTIVSRPEVDGIFLDSVEQQTGHLGQPRLGVSHGGGIIAVHIAEIALAVDQRVTLGEILRQADERVVNRLITMGVKFADDVAHDAGAFLEGGPGIQPQLPHGVKQPAVHRLQAIAHVGERPVHDGRERISEVALLECVAQPDFLNGTGIGGNQLLAHAVGYPVGLG